MLKQFSSKEAGTFPNREDSFSDEKLCDVQKTGTFFVCQIPCPARRLDTLKI